MNHESNGGILRVKVTAITQHPVVTHVNVSNNNGIMGIHIYRSHHE